MRERRVRQVALVAVGLWLVLVARLFQLQVVEHERWLEEARRTRIAGHAIPFRRGRILDRDGEVLAEDRLVHHLALHYRSFRRDHPVGQAFELLRLLGVDAGGIPGAFARGEGLAALWLGLRPEDLAVLPARERSDAVFYLARLAGGSVDGGAVRAWMASGTEPFGVAFPEAEPHFREALGRARKAWAELAAALGTEGEALSELVERERLRMDALVERRALQQAASRVLGRPVSEILRETAAPAGGAGAAVLAALEQRWRLGLPAEELAAALRGGGSTPPREILAAVEQRRPEDVRGLRRAIAYDLHRSRQPVLLRGLGFAAVDLLVQRPGDFPGLVVQAVTERAHPSGVAPHLVGRVRVPTAEDLARWEAERREYRELARLLVRTAEQEARYRALKERVLSDALRPDEARGASGIELRYESVLRGRRGFVEILETGDDERRELEFLPAQDGRDVVLTLDASLTRAAEEAIVRAWADVRADPDPEWGPEVLAALERPRCGFALLDLRDGSTPVLATTPGYRPDDFRRDFERLVSDPDRPLRQRALGGNPTAVQTPYPGSTFKPFVAAAALLQDPAAWERTYVCTGSWAPADAPPGLRPLQCDSRWGHGRIGMAEALTRSCNAYFYQLAVDLGYEPFHELARRVGFGAATGIEVAPWRLDERGTPVPRDRYGLEGGANLLFPPERVAGDVATLMRTAIGQVGVQASPLALARAYGWLATGKLWTPRLVAVGHGASPPEPPLDPPPLPESVREHLRAALHDVVASPIGTAHDRRWPLEPWRVAAKTGTAQVGGGLTHAWLAGWFPDDEPRYAFAVLCENAGVHGGQLAAVVLHHFLETSGEELLDGNP